MQNQPIYKENAVGNIKNGEVSMNITSERLPNVGLQSQLPQQQFSQQQQLPPLPSHQIPQQQGFGQQPIQGGLGNQPIQGGLGNQPIQGGLGNQLQGVGHQPLQGLGSQPIQGVGHTLPGKGVLSGDTRGMNSPGQSSRWNHPQTYERKPYNYGSSTRQDPKVPYIPPSNIDSSQRAHFQQASQAFRQFDTNRNGYLDRVEFVKAMQSLGYFFQNPHEEIHVFNLLDRDNNGRVDEREFCEYWANARNQGYGTQPQRWSSSPVLKSSKGHENPLSRSREGILKSKEHGSPVLPRSKDSHVKTDYSYERPTISQKLKNLAADMKS